MTDYDSSGIATLASDDPSPLDLARLPEPQVEHDRKWYVIQTKSRQEKALVEHMGAKGIATFLPLVPKIRTYGKRQQQSDLPLFQGYVFLFGQRADVYDADRTRHVARFIEVTDQQRLYQELSAVNQIVTAGGKLDPYPMFKAGVHVVVRAGAFKGVHGIVEDRQKMNRLILQIEILGQASSLEIDGSLLEVTD